MIFDFKNKIAIVSASTKGIGLEIALTLARHNAKVYLAARSKENAEKIINEHKDLNLSFIYFDALDDDSYHFVNEVYKIENRIDILINNFGTTNVKKDIDIIHTNYDDYLNIVKLNSKSVFVPTQDALKIMSKQNDGVIVNVSSIGGIIPDLARIAYCSSKAIVNNLTLNIAAQGAKYNVRCNAVLPGLIQTDAAINNLPEEFLKIFLKNTPLNRIGKVSDIANMVMYLASDYAQYMTGEIISVAGGFGKFTPLFSEFNKK